MSSSSRRGKVNDDKNKKKKVKPQNKKQANKSRDKKEKSSSKKKGIVRKILTILLGFAIFCVFAATAFMIYIVVIGILSVGLVTYYVIKKQIV